MKLKYRFEFMDMDDSVVAVPIGGDADEFHGVIRLNDSAAAIMKLLSEETSVETVVDSLAKKYDSSRDELEQYVRSQVAKLQDEGLIA